MATSIKQLFVAAVISIAAVTAQAGSAHRSAAADITEPKDLWATTSTNGLSTFTDSRSCASAGNSHRAEKYVPHNTDGTAFRPVAGKSRDRIEPLPADACVYMKVEHGEWVWAFVPKGQLFWFHPGDQAPYALDACGNSLKAVGLLSSGGGTTTMMQSSDAGAIKTGGDISPVGDGGNHKGFWKGLYDGTVGKCIDHPVICTAVVVYVGYCSSRDDFASCKNDKWVPPPGVGGTFDPPTGGVGGTFNPQGSTFNGNTGGVSGSFDPQGSMTTTNTGGVGGTFN